MSSDRADTAKRRTFLKKAVATAAAAGLGAGGFASDATARAEPVEPERAESLLSAHAGDLLDALAADGLVDGVADLPTGRAVDYRGVARSEEGTALLSVPGRERELTVVRRTDAGPLTITVEPDTDTAYAMVETDDDRILYDLDAGARGVTTQECCTFCDCTNVLCSGTSTCVEDCETQCYAGGCPTSVDDPVVVSDTVYTSDSCVCGC